MGAFDSFVSRIPDSSENTDFNSELTTRLELAQKAYKKEFGKDLPITSKGRTREEQKDLYQRFKKGESGIYMPLNPDEYPNQKTFHNDAVDISSNVSNDFLKSFGLHRPLGKNDPVHTTIDPSFKAPETPIESTFTSRIPEEAPVYEAPAAPTTGFYNPNLVRQGQNAAPGDGLQNLVENTSKELGGMSWEDWKKNSLTANAIKYGASTILPSSIFGDWSQEQKESQEKLKEAGQGLYQAFRHPLNTISAISEQEPGTVLGGMLKGGVYDAPLALASRGVTAPLGQISKATRLTEFGGKLAAKAGEGVADASRKIENLQQSFSKYKNQPKSNVSLEPLDLTQPQMVGGGAALTSNAEAVKNALYNSNPELIADLMKQSGVSSFEELPFNRLPLDVIERHNKFSKFDMTPTEGEALQDIKKMSIETNERTKDDLIRARLEERDPKLIAGFNKIRETVAPDVYETNPAKLANAALEKLKQNYEARTANEAALYKRLEDANGGNFPMNIGELDKNIVNTLKAKKSFRDVESHPMYQELKDQMATGKMSFDDFEHFRTRLATAMRSAKDGNVRFGLGIIRDELENMPIPENLSHLKPLADEARQAFREHKQLQKDLPAYKAAIDDTRTPEEILKGDLHPASNEFINKFYGPNTKQVELNRLLNEIGINSVEHQGLNAATIDKIKRASGVKGEFGNETGKISQASLSDQLNKSSPNTYGNNLSTMFKPEHLKDLKDLSDVANMTEHVKGGHSVNVSNTALEENRLKNKAEAEKIALGLLETGGNVVGKGFGGTVARKAYETTVGKLKAAEATKKAEEAAKKRVSPSAGINLEDLMNTGKQ